jgi:hypothetical protein
MKKSFALLFIISCISFSSLSFAENNDQLRHLILLKFKSNLTAGDFDKTKNTFLALSGKIEAISSIEWGKNNSVERLNKSFTHSYLITFRTEKDRELYLKHPAHKALGDEIGGFIDDILVFDYWAN